MDRHITAIVNHMAKSHEEMARILEAKRMVTVRMAETVCAIPDHTVAAAGLNQLMKQSSELMKSIAAYASSLADFEDAIGDNIKAILKEHNGPSTINEE